MKKRQTGQFPRWTRDPWAAEGASACCRQPQGLRFDALRYFFSKKLLKYFPEMPNILEAKDSVDRKADI